MLVKTLAHVSSLGLLTSLSILISTSQNLVISVTALTLPQDSELLCIHIHLHTNAFVLKLVTAESHNFIMVNNCQQLRL